MRIFLEKFGAVLVSRPSGKEAFLALQSMLTGLNPHEPLDLDFTGVMVLAPSWADEFISPLMRQFPGRVVLHHTDNPSVIASLKTLEKAGKAERSND